MELSIRDYCRVVALSITAYFIGDSRVSENDPMFSKLLDDLEKEVKEAYREQGSPYGETDADLVRWLMDNLEITEETEDVELNGHELSD